MQSMSPSLSCVVLCMCELLKLSRTKIADPERFGLEPPYMQCQHLFCVLSPRKAAGGPPQGSSGFGAKGMFNKKTNFHSVLFCTFGNSPLIFVLLQQLLH